jgi:hypothetical protein
MSRTVIWAWWIMPIIPATSEAMQENLKFEASLSNIEKPYLKKEKKKRRTVSVLPKLKSRMVS